MIATLTAALGTLALLNPCCAAQDKIEKARKTAPEDRQEIIRRLTADYERARSQLEKKDPGAGTRTLQRKIIEGLDKLLDPPDDGRNPQDPRPPQSPSPAGAEPARKPANSAAGPRKTTRPGGEAIAKKPAASANEDQGEGWRVTLPPRQLPDADAFARERFVPRYEELLRAYYRRIAEGARHRDRDE